MRLKFNLKTFLYLLLMKQCIGSVTKVALDLGMKKSLIPILGLKATDRATNSLKTTYTITDNTMTIAATDISVNDLVSSIISNTNTLTLEGVIRFSDHIQMRISDKVEKLAAVLKNIPAMVSMLSRRETLQDHFNNLEHVSRETMILKNLFDQNHKLSKERYRNFRHDNEAAITRNILQIYDFILDKGTKTYLTDTLLKDIQKFTNVCKSGMSHQQLLQSILKSVKVASSQYLLVKKYIHEFLDYIGDTNSVYEKSLSIFTNLNNEVLSTFRTALAESSREIWACDPKRGYSNNTDLYFELNAFTNYIVREDQFESLSSKCHANKADHCQIKEKLNSCRIKDNFCEHTTKWCPTALQKCKTISEEKINICTDSDSSSTKRYSAFAYDSEVHSLHFCENGKITDISWLRTSNPPKHVTFTCYYCECICQEQTVYYIGTSSSLAHSYRDRNEVMIGARLCVKDNTISVQVKIAKLLPYGAVDQDPDTTYWMACFIDKATRKKITPDTMIDLTELEVLDKNRVLVGLKFNEISPNKFALQIATAEFDYAKGVLNSEKDVKFDTPAPARKQYVQYDSDVPTKYEKTNNPNTPTSNKTDYMKFTVTSRQKDGGQTTIPFIDLQNVETHPTSILSGAGLFIRSQKGYGGFLSLKLFTYNVVPYY